MPKKTLPTQRQYFDWVTQMVKLKDQIDTEIPGPVGSIIDKLSSATILRFSEIVWQMAREWERDGVDPGLRRQKLVTMIDFDQTESLNPETLEIFWRKAGGTRKSFRKVWSETVREFSLNKEHWQGPFRERHGG